MKLFINGEEKHFDAVSNIQDVMQQTGMLERKAAVALNGGFISKTQYEHTTIKDGDQLEIIAPMQGG